MVTLKARANLEGEMTSKNIRRLQEEISMKTYVHGPMDLAKTLKLRFRVADLDLPERRGMPVKVYQ